MSTTLRSDGRRTEPTRPFKFYAPAAAEPSSEPGPIERFVTALYDRHRVFTRRLE